MSEITYVPIGIIHSEHLRPQETPIQPVYAAGCRGTVEIYREFVDGLQDIDGFSHLYLIYHFDRADPPALVVKPFLQDSEHGVFSTRSPRRPNPVGLSIVRLLRREDNRLLLEDVDILDGTPLLDIKPYVARFDRMDRTRNGWQDEVTEETASRLGKRGYPG
jgi:tRNA-Thr(GGU) m(6)t(6)A37 methyltransferase TsaA